MNERIIPRRPADTSRITLRDGADVCYWTTELDASEEELVLAMREVGPTAIAVRAYFRTHAHSPVWWNSELNRPSDQNRAGNTASEDSKRA